MLKKLVSRNFKLYFRDRMAVFFSLLAVLIVIVLYILFLSDLQVNTVNDQMHGSIDKDIISYLINSWILAGLLSITAVTSTLGAFGTMVNDREKKLIMDFKSSPLKNWVYPVAGIITAVIVGSIISIVSFVIYGIYIYADTGYSFSITQIGQCLGVIILSSFMSAALMGFLVSFFSTNSAFSSASLIVGTTIGFLNGLYVPMGSLPKNVQTVLKCLPFGHIASMFRRVLMSDSIKRCFKDAPDKTVDSYTHSYGVNLTWNGSDIAIHVSCIFIVAVLIVSLILMFLNYSRKKREL